ncbi:MAG: hypothetical protein AAF203_11330, partial [Pseudomonadota bacterium]
QQKTKNLEIGNSYDVHAGQGCLTLRLPIPFGTMKDCNIQIVEKQQTVYQLAVFEPTWDSQLFKIAFGPKPNFKVRSPASSFEMTLSPYAGHKSKIELKDLDILSFAIYALAGQYIHEIPNVEGPRNFTIKPGEIKTVDLSPLTDTRANIELDFLDDPAAFTRIQGNYVVLKYTDKINLSVSPRLTSAPFNMTTKKGYGFRVSTYNPNDGTYNYYIASSQGAFPRPYKVFPQFEKFSIVVNEVEEEMTLSPGGTFKQEIATLNVKDFESGKPGFFKIFIEENGKLIPINYKSSEFSKTLIEYDHPTNGSLNLLPNKTYWFRFFITDNLGKTTQQDEIQVSL